MGKKGQVSTEFVFSIGIILLMFLTIATFSVDRNTILNKLYDSVKQKNECLRISNIINSVYVGGDGTESNFKTEYLITLYNSSTIGVQKAENITEVIDNKIAFLASEAGPSSQDFYNKINNNFDPDPDWYKVCFSDIGGSGCDWQGTSWMNSLIPENINDLMNNLNNYQTIYLEDAHIYYTTNYIQLLSDWVSKGNVLILSEHSICREQSSGNYPSTSYRCNPPGSYKSDNWDIFNITVHQRYTAWGWPNNWNVEVNDTNEAYTLVLGDRLSFEERSWIENKNAGNTFFSVARYRNTANLGDSRRKPSIAHWDYGNGRIFYIGDFQVEYIGKNADFEDVLSELVKVAYYILVDTSGGDVFCPISVNAPYKQIIGEVKIKNKENTIVIENVTSA
ncbi:hypothetical protein HYX16_05035 [Candidatus Woesearchaeota archaeon]|nr:hypothetical protein [Candidatus Woesearchaeota archaeon]